MFAEDTMGPNLQGQFSGNLTLIAGEFPLKQKVNHLQTSMARG